MYILTLDHLRWWQKEITFHATTLLANKINTQEVPKYCNRVVTNQALF